MSDIRSVLNTQALSLIENTEGSSDPIRNSIDSYWTYNGDTLVYDTGNSYNSSENKAITFLLNFDLSGEKHEPNSEPDPIKLDDRLEDSTSITMRTYTQKVSITPRYPADAGFVGKTGSGGRVEVDPEAQFDSYIENSIIPALGVPQSEFKLDLDSPLEYASNVQNFSAIAGTVNFVYNYGLEVYENKIKDTDVSESELNNFYKFETTENLSIVSGMFSSVVSVTAPVPAPKTKKRVSEKLDSSPTTEERIQDFFMNREGFIEALDIQEKRDTFPFYNEVYLTNPARKNSVDKLEEALKDSGLIMAFCTLMNREDAKLTRDNESATIRNPDFTNSYLSSSYIDNTQQQFKEQSAVRVSQVKLYDIPGMLKIMYEAIPRGEAVARGSSDGSPTVDLDTSSLRAKAFLTDGEQAQYSLDTISKKKADTNIVVDYENALDDFVEEINNLITNVGQFKRYRQLLDGTMATYQSDVLFYRIKKFEQGSDTPIQNFWIPAEKGYRGVRYIDTQVKYGKMYRYEVCAFKMVLGSDYFFSEQNVGVVSFEEELEKYVEEIQEPLSSMIGLGLIRPSFEEMYSQFPDSLPGFAPDFKDKLVDQQTTVALAEAVDQNHLFSREMVKVNSGSAIDIAAQAVLSGRNIPGSEVNLSMLTEEEKQAFQNIRSSWECLSNINGTGFGTLAEIEITARNISVLGQIQEIIIQELTDEKKRNTKLKAWVIGLVVTAALVTLAVLTFGSALPGAFATLSAAANAPAAAGIAASFGLVVASKAAAATMTIGTTIGGIVATGALGVATTAIAASSESKKSNQTGLTVDNLELNDIERIYQKINALTAIPLPFLNSSSQKQLLESSGVYFIDFPDDPETFDLDNVDVPRLNTGLVKFDTDQSGSEYRQQKREELKQIENLLAKETKKIESLIETWNGCYIDFVESARSIDIVADYKRINKYKLQVRLQPSLKFAELPYYSSEGMILDNPPIYPNVNVITYRGVPDTFSFFMNSGQGQIEIEPISFSDEEDTFITNYRKSRKLNDFQPFLYKSDEKENLGTLFEIRRIEEPPKDYQSFREATVNRVNETIANGKALPAATFNEEIMSNKKYYYIFRVLDRRGTVSYPSGVMEIEIVENSGIVYPLIKPYEFEKPKTDTTKNLKRLLNIVPRITQVVPPADTASYSGLSAGATTILGREEEGLFGKQFKLRLTSKKTGKVVDLNLNFNATVVERAEAE